MQQQVTTVGLDLAKNLFQVHGIASVNVVEIGWASEVVIGQAARGGICAGSGSAAGASSSAMPSSCM